MTMTQHEYAPLHMVRKVGRPPLEVGITIHYPDCTVSYRDVAEWETLRTVTQTLVEDVLTASSKGVSDDPR